MRSFSVSPIEMFASLWRNRELIKASAKREVLGALSRLCHGHLVVLLQSIVNARGIHHRF
ncbi:ABC transporter [Pseudomonas aeruginosa]|nr:ABC transporter [Pseudomonas aeruginosa]